MAVIYKLVVIDNRMNKYSNMYTIIFFFLLIGCSEPSSTQTKLIETENVAFKVKEGFEELISIENAKKRLTETDKLGLIYFRSDLDVNCHKLEDEFVGSQEFESLTRENYLCFEASLDEGTVVEESGVTQQGKYMKLMINHFNNESTPFFVIIDKDGNKLDELVAHPKYMFELKEFIEQEGKEDLSR